MMPSAKQQRDTPQKAAVQRALESFDGFVTVNEIHDRIKAHGDHASIASVYRIVRGLIAEEKVDCIGSEDRETLIRVCSTAEHHHHLICRSCRTALEVVDQSLERLLVKIALQYGYTELRHQVELTGICTQCHESGG